MESGAISGGKPSIEGPLSLDLFDETLKKITSPLGTIAKIYDQRPFKIMDLFKFSRQHIGDLKAFITTVAEQLISTDAPLERHVETIKKVSRNPLLLPG